jgi:Protein of unknown function (DUF2783)
MSTLPFEHLEQVYEHLAEAIDRAGPEHEALFLAKLVLALANELSDAATVKRCMDTAGLDLVRDDLVRDRSS